VSDAGRRLLLISIGLSVADQHAQRVTRLFWMAQSAGAWHYDLQQLITFFTARTYKLTFTPVPGKSLWPSQVTL
jgi:hypothetical protein